MKVVWIDVFVSAFSGPYVILSILIKIEQSSVHFTMTGKKYNRSIQTS